MQPVSTESELEKRVVRKATWRIVPFIIACYFFAYLDRVNVGIASLQMNDAIGLSAAAFGFGSGAFFLGYFFFEVPSNLFLRRFGARRWIARIMITWGILAAMMVWVSGPVSFAVLRFLLGVAEAGFYPGILLYITFFFPSAHRARIIAIFTTGVPLSLFLGSPVSTLLLELHGWMGLDGWQWMFLLEALPSVLLGIACLWVLSDGPEKAGWLNDEERDWLTTTLAEEKRRGARVPSRSVWPVLLDPRVLGCAFVYAGVAASSVGLAVWQPQIIKSHGLSNLEAGLLNAVPYGIAVVGMILWGRMSDRSTNRTPYVLIPLVLISLALASTGLISALSLTVVSLSIAVAATYSFKGPFWAFITEHFQSGEVPVILAHINAIGGLGSFLGSYLFGLVKSATGSYALGLLPIVALTLAGSLILVVVAVRQRPARPGPSHPSAQPARKPAHSNG